MYVCMCICPHQINFMPWLCECTCLLIWGGLLWILIAYSFILVVLWTGVLFVHDDKSETTLIKDYIYIYYFMQCNNVLIFNFQKSQSFEKLYVSIPPSGNIELFNYSIVAAYGLEPAERLLVSRVKLVQTSHLKSVGECRPGNADYLLSVALWTDHWRSDTWNDGGS